MNLKETLEKCPKAAELYYQWSGDCLRKLQAKFALEIPDGVESTIPEIDRETIKRWGGATLLTNQRSLYDFFDGQQIWVVVDYDFDRIDAPEWFHRMAGETSAYYNSRTETELYAFIKAFTVLEEKLNKDEKNS